MLSLPLNVSCNGDKSSANVDLREVPQPEQVDFSAGTVSVIVGELDNKTMHALIAFRFRFDLPRVAGS